MSGAAANRYPMLIGSALAFTVCSMVWMMFAVIGIPIQRALGLNETEFGLLVATPVLSGTLIRLPLARWSERFGGRIVLFMLMISTTIPIYLTAMATELWQFLIVGLITGLAGGSFSVGISYATHRFPERQPSPATGFSGAGYVGTALTLLVAPLILLSWGWQAVPQIYSALMLAAALLFLFTSFSSPQQAHNSDSSVLVQLSALKDPQVWRYSLYYAIVFGGHVALALWMTKYYVAEFGLDITSAALLTTALFLPAGVLCNVGGALSAKYGAHMVTWWVLWVSLFCLFLLSYPQTEFIIHTTQGPAAFHLRLGPLAFTMLLFVLGMAWAFGMAAVFHYISDDFPHSQAASFGIVGIVGGLGGFILPIVFGTLVDLTGVRSSAFMLMFGIIWVALMWMYWTEVRPQKVAHPLQHEDLAPGMALNRLQHSEPEGS